MAKYLWINEGPQHNQSKYIYLSSDGKKICGNIVGDSDTISPYSDKSIYPNAKCLGEVKTFVEKIEPNLYENYEYIGLTNVTKNEYNILNQLWRK